MFVAKRLSVGVLGWCEREIEMVEIYTAQEHGFVGRAGYWIMERELSKEMGNGDFAEKEKVGLLGESVERMQ